MYVIVRIAGKMCEGIVLAVSRERARIALRDCHDTVELRKTDGRWTFHDGNPVELEYVIYSAGLDRFLLGSGPEHAPLQAA